MSEPAFLLQLVYPDGSTVTFHAGHPGNNPACVEAQIIEDCKKAILKRGVGLLKTENSVSKAIEEGIAEAFYNFKLRSVPHAITVAAANE